jgi:hypothetical protein
MTTKLENVVLDVAHFDNFRHLIPGYDKMDQWTIDNLLGLGILQVSTAFEHAIAAVGGHTVVSEDQYDLDNGNDAKLSTVRFSNNKRSYTAPISNVHNKTGTLCVQVYERINNSYYFFMIPKEAHEKIGLKSTIEIPFELDGTPRFMPKGVSKLPNWWQYQVPSFKDLGK